MHNRAHTKITSLIYIVIGSLFIFMSFEILYKLLLLIVGIGFIFYGFLLRGFNARLIMQRFIMGMFR